MEKVKLPVTLASIALILTVLISLHQATTVKSAISTNVVISEIQLAGADADDEFVELYNLTEKKEFEKATGLQKKLYALIKAMFVETNPSPAKYALRLLNKMEDNVRLPLVGVGPQSQTEIKSALSNLGLL